MNSPLLKLIFVGAWIGVSCGDPAGPTKTKTTSDPPNNPPTLVEHPDTTTTAGSTIWLTPVAYDIDGDSLTYECFVNTSMSDIRRGTIPVYTYHDDLQILEFHPKEYDRPNRKVYFLVFDGNGGSDTTSFYVHVN